MRAELSARLVDWLEERRVDSGLRVASLAWDELDEWRLEEGILRHRTGRFFSVAALEPDVPRPSGVQPIIVQPEVGTLGFMLTGRGDDTKVLLNAKTEPGNVGATQVAPTVQATVSNYARVHGGAATPYLEAFHEPTSARVVSDSLQSEQGTRFLGKYNRNMTLFVDGALAAHGESFRWFSVREALSALELDFCVNTDARSVLVSSDWNWLCGGEPAFSRHRRQGGLGEALFASMQAQDERTETSQAEIEARFRARREVSGPRDPAHCRLDAATRWERRADGFYDLARERFDVRLFSVSTRDREVSAWQQPLLAGCKEEHVVLLCQVRRGILHFLFRESREPGFREAFQLGPTVQSELCASEDPLLAYLRDGNIVERKSARQSDEGGRFFHSVTRYRVVEADERDDVPKSAADYWLSLRQIHNLLRKPGVMTNEARSVLSLLLPLL